MNAQGRWSAATLVALSAPASAQVVLIDPPGEGPDWITAGSVNNPPDCWIAVGEGVFGVVVNHHMAFYTKDVGLPLHDENGQDAPFDFGNRGYDPRINWDSLRDSARIGVGSVAISTRPRVHEEVE
jgi:hypothetical protein